MLGRVDREKTVKKSETPASKKKRADDSPKPSSKKSKSSNKPRSDVRDLDKKWGQHFARLEPMLLSKTFAVPVEPVKKPSSVVTSDQPFFDPGTSTSGLSSGVTVAGASPSLAQTTGEAAFVSEAASKSATHAVEGPRTEVVRRGDEIQQNATQPVEAPGAGMATRLLRLPVQVLRFCYPVPVVLCSLTVRKICKVSLVPLLLTTSDTAPQTKMFPVTKNSLRKLVTERPPEG